MNKKLISLSLWTIVIVAISILIVLKFAVLDSGKSLGQSIALGNSKVSIQSSDPNEVNLDNIIINIRSDHYKILKADFGLKLKNSSSQKALEENMHAVRSAILQHITIMDSSQLHTEKGKERLKESLIELLENNYGFQIETLFFKNFILVPHDS